MSQKSQFFGVRVPPLARAPQIHLWTAKTSTRHKNHKLEDQVEFYSTQVYVEGKKQSSIQPKYSMYGKAEICIHML